MALTLQVPDDYRYVLASVASTFFVNIYHVMVVSKHRRISGVLYPNAYGSDEAAQKDNKVYKFNCAQRCHDNFKENYIIVLPAMLIAGLRFPLTTAVLGAVWGFGRILYTRGYTSDAGPKGRVFGGTISHLGDIPLLFMSAYTAVVTALNM